MTLIRQEFRKSEQDDGADSVGIGDLLVGTVGFAMLQRWGRKNTESEMHSNGGDGVVFDVVVLDNGARADVIAAAASAADMRDDPDKRASFVSLLNDDAVELAPNAVDSLARTHHFVLSPEHQRGISDEELRFYIMQQLPRGCRASIRMETISARTITVDILDDENAEIAAPPGTKMIAESFHHDKEDHMDDQSSSQRRPKHTVVFQTALSNEQSEDVVSPEKSIEAKVEGGAIEGSVSACVVGTGVLPDDSGRDSYGHDELSHETPTDKVVGIGSSQPAKGAADDCVEHPASPSQSSSASNRRGNAGGVRGLSVTSRNDSEDHKSNSLRKRSLAKLAHKVKQNGGERTERKRPGQKSTASAASPNSSHLATNRTHPNKSTASAIPVGRRNVQQLKSLPNPGTRQNETAAAANRPVQSPLLESGPMRVSLPSNVSRPVRVSNARSIQPRDLRNSSAEYLSYREKNRESFLAQRDAYSIVPVGGAPLSHVRSSSAISVTRSDAEVTVSLNGESMPASNTQGRRSSVVSLATGPTENPLILAPRRRGNEFHEDAETIQALHRDGFFPGLFPENHLVRNVRRFCRFSAASYGPSALKVMGIHSTPEEIYTPDDHEHSAFSTYAGLPPSSILLSSFEDPEGGSNAAGETETGFPLVHYLCIDHESKAIVLTLRGTWGFEDVLTDMTCDYDDLEYLGRSWKVHKGMHASAKRLLHGGSARVMVTIRAALDEYPNYGMVFCGHSLGGGVAALLATMISTPNEDANGTSFVTASHESAAMRSRLLRPDDDDDDHNEKFHEPSYFLPPGRPIHVYAYGPPAVMSPLLRRATCGLITTIVNGRDMVPSLSLGILHDMHAVSVMFKGDASSKSQIRSRFWEGFRQSIINKFYVDQPPTLLYAGDGIGEDAWAWKTLNMLRGEMCSPKLVPPGEVFLVDTSRVLQRDPFAASRSASDAYPRLGRPATRVQLRFIRSVETWFGELRFGSGMFADHNPARYEANIAALSRGVLDF